MKILKNHSVTNHSVINYFVIFGLALVFLFLSSCGKKEDSNEIKLPLETRQIKKVVKKNPPKQSEKSAGVLITAKLISDDKIIPKNLFAEIKIKNNKNHPDLSIASSTNCDNGKITFPEIKKGLTDLFVYIKADNIAVTFSDYFDTLDGTNKTVEIKVNAGVVWRGNVKHSDGTPVTNFHLLATPRGLYENQKNIGHIDKTIKANQYGDCEITGLLNEHYKLNLFTDNA